MYKDILKNIDNIAIWPTISFVIFFLFFLGLLWWVFAVDKVYISHMSDKPFDDGIKRDLKPDLKSSKN